VVLVGIPFRRCAGRHDERTAQGQAHASKRMSPAAVEGPFLDGTTSPSGVPGRWTFPETGLVVSVRKRNERVVVPRVRAAWTCVRSARRVLACPNRRRVSQPPGLYKPSAFLRVSQRPPLRRHPCWSPLPRACARFGPTPPSARHVPPSPFLPASTVSSTNRFAGLLRPASDPEVHRVATHRRRMPATASALSHRCSPSRAFPFREAVPASPRGLAPLSFFGNADATSRPCSARKSVAATTRGRSALLDALLGFPTWSPS